MCQKKCAQLAKVSLAGSQEVCNVNVAWRRGVGAKVCNVTHTQCHTHVTHINNQIPNARFNVLSGF